MKDDKTLEERVNYYLSLPYTYCFVGEPEGGWFVYVKELPGCMSQGDALDEAYEMIRDAMAGWLEIEIMDAMDVPLPDETRWS